jgi:hypothetical protein
MKWFRSGTKVSGPAGGGALGGGTGSGGTTVVGSVSAAGVISMKNFSGGLIVLADGASVPSGLPNGTIIARYSSA